MRKMLSRHTGWNDLPAVSSGENWDIRILEKIFFHGFANILGHPKMYRIFRTLGLSDKWAVEAFFKHFWHAQNDRTSATWKHVFLQHDFENQNDFLAKIVLISLIIYAINYHRFKFGEIRSIFLIRRTDLVCLDKIVIFAKIVSCKNRPELFPPRHTPVNFSQNDPLIYRHLPKLRFAAATCSHGSQTTSKLSQNWQNCIPLHA